MNRFVDTCEYSIIVILIITITWMIYVKHTVNNIVNEPLEWINQAHPSNKYGKHNPTDRLRDTVGRFGKPDMIDKSKGGSAVWKKSTLEKRGFCWDRVEIKDEQIPHTNPGPHVDFLYYSYKLAVPKELICDITNLSESITYDTLKKIITARCHFDGAIISTIILAKRIANKEMSLDDAKKSYGPFIFSTIKEHDMYNPDSVSTMLNELYQHKLSQKWIM